MFRAFYLSVVLCAYDKQILNLMNTSCVSDTQDSLQSLLNFFFDFIQGKPARTIPTNVGQIPTLNCSAATGIRGKCRLVVVVIIIIIIIMRSARKNLEAVPGKHSIDSLQKTAIIGTSHIIRKVLQCET